MYYNMVTMILSHVASSGTGLDGRLHAVWLASAGASPCDLASSEVRRKQVIV